MEIIHLKTIDSTHLYALRLLEDADFLGRTVAIVADKQTEGIGRCGRNWVSDSGNLFVSIVTDVPAHSDIGQISLTSACAVREAVVRILNKEISRINTAVSANNISDSLKLHWPNDIFYDGKKLSGILLALSGKMLILSVGINVNSSPCLDRPSTSIKEILNSSEFSAQFRQTELHLEGVLDILLHSVLDWLSHLYKSGFSEVRSYWLQNACDIKRKVQIKNKGSIFEGIFLDIDNSGRVILEMADGGRLPISSGDLFESGAG